jgi:hypothetical protein
VLSVDGSHNQRTLVHQLYFLVKALIAVEVPKVVDGVKRGYVLRTPCLLITSQRTVVHHLRIFEAASRSYQTSCNLPKYDHPN